ncbi:MAG: N-6 DNA methylase [Flavobacterium sp.]|nr:N-6 DNA methylase [Flavobacterium sp.]
MKNLSEILVWKQNFGLLPIHLKPTINDFSYVMLNGGYGDFCLQTVKDNTTETEYYSKSWSSNTKNFVVLDKEKIKIYNWQKDKPEIISQKDVADNFSKFYTYLLSKTVRTPRDVVPFITDIFRRFRNLTLEKKSPVEALNLLFILLTTLEEDYVNFDFAKWNIDAVNIPSGFDNYVDRIKKGIINVAPDFDLIIRHSAGVLFQEAQKEVLYFDPQIDLWGNPSSKIDTSAALYSSIHYTPPYIARTIVENVLRKLDLSKHTLKIFDPACGSAEFLIEVLKQLKELNYEGSVEIIGWDSSPTAINTSKFLLAYEKRIVWNNRLNFEIDLVNDSLTQHWSNDYDLILMNPPFVSWELLKNKDDQSAVRETLGNNFIGKPNQASAFFYKAIQHINQEGVLGCVIPSSILTLDAYKNLRAATNDLLTIAFIAKLGNFVFEDALTDVTIFIGQKPKINIIPTILWASNEKGVAQNALRDFRKMTYSNELAVDEKKYSLYQPVSFPLIRDSWKPISLNENELLKTIERFVKEKKLVRIEDVFNVSLGIRQGAKNIFKINESEYEQMPLNEKKYFRLVIDNDAINDATLFKKQYIWYPYYKAGMIFKSEDELAVNASTFYKKVLKPNETILKNRKDKVVLTNWWGHTRPGNWQFEKGAKLVSTEFGKSNSFAFDKTGEFVVERGNAWLPRNKFSDGDYFFYLALFSSSFFDKLLSIYSKQLLSGWDLGKKHTKEIPIPNVHSEDIKNSIGYIKLVEKGKELSMGNSYIKPVLNDLIIKYFYPHI